MMEATDKFYSDDCILHKDNEPPRTFELATMLNEVA